jgi:hypothetical protein
MACVGVLEQIHAVMHMCVCLNVCMAGAAEQWRCGDADGVCGRAAGGHPEILRRCKTCGAGDIYILPPATREQTF